MRRTTRIVGHYAPWLLGSLLVALIVATLVLPVSAFLPWPALAAVLVVAFFMGTSIRAHNRRLCERCIASLPLDASTVANRYARRFRVALSVYVTHQRLQPWCPYCRSGGEDQVSPSTPTPVSSQL